MIWQLKQPTNSHLTQLTAEKTNSAVRMNLQQNSEGPIYVLTYN